MKSINFLFGLIISISFSACTSAGVILIDPSQKYAPTKNVELLLEEPTQEYIVIAIVEGNGSQYNNEMEVLKSMRKKAMKIGAHGLLLVKTEKLYVPPSTHANPVQGGAPITIMGGNQITTKAVAIRFID